MVGIEDLNLRAQMLAIGFIVALFACLPVVAAPAAREKSVWNYDGGVILETDGSTPQRSVLSRCRTHLCAQFLRQPQAIRYE